MYINFITQNILNYGNNESVDRNEFHYWHSVVSHNKERVLLLGLSLQKILVVWDSLENANSI